MDEPQRPVYTAGMRADEFARRITATHAAQFGWTAPFHVLLRHLDAIHGSDGRFDRIEATPSGVAIPTLPTPRTFRTRNDTGRARRQASRRQTQHRP